MKKKYIAPSFSEIEIDTNAMLAMSLKDEKVSIDSQLSNDRRGKWGNLWGN